MTPAQQKALAELKEKHCVSLEQLSAVETEVFAQAQPLCLEIGFGKGLSLCQMAQENPDVNFIGIEVHEPGIGSLLQAIEQHGLNNLKIIHADAFDVLERLKPQSLARVQVLFPDPGPKKKHHKRRIVQKPLLDKLYDLLAETGILHIATDWQDYADWIQEELNSFEKFTPTSSEQTNDSYLMLQRPVTKFEQRGLNLGHSISDFILSKTKL